MSQILSTRRWIQIPSLQRYQIKTKITANVTIPAMTPPIDNPPPWWSSLSSSGCGKLSGSGNWSGCGKLSGSGKGKGLPGLPETKRDKLIIRSIFNIVTRVQLKLLFSKTSLHKLVLNFPDFFPKLFYWNIETSFNSPICIFTVHNPQERAPEYFRIFSREIQKVRDQGAIRNQQGRKPLYSPKKPSFFKVTRKHSAEFL